MKCLECQEALSSILDGEGPGDRTEVDQHLARCHGCRSYEVEISLLRGALRNWPDEIPRRETGAPRDAPIGTDAGHTRRPILAAAAAMLALGLVAGFLAGRRYQPSQEAESTMVVPAIIEVEKTVYPERHEVHSAAVLLVADPSRIKAR